MVAMESRPDTHGLRESVEKLEAMGMPAPGLVRDEDVGS